MSELDERDTVLEELVEDSKLLQALYDAGVENWEGFDLALKIYMEQDNV